MKVGEKLGSSVAPLNPAIAAYMRAVEVFKSHQCVPALLSAIDKAILAKAGFTEIIESVSTLLSEDDDKFWGAYGSKYLRPLDCDELGISHFRPREPTLQSGLKLVWGRVSLIKPDDLIGFEKTLVNWSEWSALDGSRDATSNDARLKSGEESADADFDRIRGAVYNMAVTLEEASVESKRLAETCNKNGLGMIPWAYVLIETGNLDSDFVQELREFSDYLQQYYGSTASTASFIQLPDSQKADLARLLGATIFSRLLHSQGLSFDSVDELHQFRLEYLDQLTFAEVPESYALYVASIVNISLMCSVLGANSLQLGLLTAREVCQSDFSFCNAVDHDFLNLSLVPSEALSHLLPVINPWEGDREGCIDLSNLLRLLRIGKKKPRSGEHFESFHHDVIKALHVEDDVLGLAVAQYAAYNLADVVIPLGLLEHLPRLTEADCYSDYGVLNSISQKLRLSDETGDYESQFVPTNWLDDFVELDLDSDQHPALYATKFSNRERFLHFRFVEWLNFVEALNTEGQAHYACVLMALMFKIKRVFASYNVQSSDRLPPRETSVCLQALKFHKSFALVEAALRDYISVIEPLPPEYRGVYRAVVSINSALRLETVNASGHSKAQFERQLLEQTPNLRRLNRKSRESVLNAYCMSRDPAFAPYKLDGDAVSSYASGIENEIAHRIGDISPDLLPVLQSHDIRARCTRNGVVLDGLGAMGRFLDKVLVLDKAVGEAFPLLRPLAAHEGFRKVCESIVEISALRNRYSHGRYDRDDAKCKRDLLRVEKLLFEDKFLDILSSTAVTIPRI